MNRLLRRIILLIFLVFIFNLVWEILHSSLYISFMLEENYWRTILFASLGDVLYVSLIFGIVSLNNNGFKWISILKNRDYWLVAFLGILTAVFVELKAAYLGKWVYTEAMPTIFGIGISPLLQLAVTASLALWVAGKINLLERRR